jgi:hypothetical protein
MLKEEKARKQKEYDREDEPNRRMAPPPPPPPGYAMEMDYAPMMARAMAPPMMAMAMAAPMEESMMLKRMAAPKMKMMKKDMARAPMNDLRAMKMGKIVS